MKFLVVGSGRMTHAIVHDLARQPFTTQVTIAARNMREARLVAKRGKNTKVVKLDLDDRPHILSLMHAHDVAISAVPYMYNYDLARAAIASQCHFVDLGGNNTVVKKQFSLSKHAKKQRVAIVPDAGLAPGMASTLVAAGLAHYPKLKDVHDVRVRVGGLPQAPREPLNYKLVFSANGLINEYIEPAVELKNSKIHTTQSMQNVEKLHFPGVGWLEAFTTSGGTSTMPQTFKGLIKNLNYKTIRYSGHAEKIRLLFELGMGSSKPTILNGTPVVPRELLQAHLKKHLTYPSRDIVLVRIIITSHNQRVHLEFIDEEQKGLTAMQRCTGFPAAIVAGMLADGTIRERGTLKHELDIPPEPFLKALTKRNIKVKKTVGRI